MKILWENFGTHNLLVLWGVGSKGPSLRIYFLVFRFQRLSTEQTKLLCHHLGMLWPFWDRQRWRNTIISLSKEWSQFSQYGQREFGENLYQKIHFRNVLPFFKVQVFCSRLDTWFFNSMAQPINIYLPNTLLCAMDAKNRNEASFLLLKGTQSD